MKNTLQDAAMSVLSESFLPIRLINKANFGGFKGGDIEKLYEKVLVDYRGNESRALEAIDKFIDGLAAIRLNTQTVAAVGQAILKNKK